MSTEIEAVEMTIEQQLEIIKEKHPTARIASSGVIRLKALTAQMTDCRFNLPEDHFWEPEEEDQEERFLLWRGTVAEAEPFMDIDGIRVHGERKWIGDEGFGGLEPRPRWSESNGGWLVHPDVVVKVNEFLAANRPNYPEGAIKPTGFVHDFMPADGRKPQMGDTRMGWTCIYCNLLWDDWKLLIHENEWSDHFCPTCKVEVKKHPHEEACEYYNCLERDDKERNLYWRRHFHRSDQPEPDRQIPILSRTIKSMKRKVREILFMEKF